MVTEDQVCLSLNAIKRSVEVKNIFERLAKSITGHHTGMDWSEQGILEGFILDQYPALECLGQSMKLL